MANGADVPAQLREMIKITGTLEAPGAADNPTIIGWANIIGTRFPKMLKYCAVYKHDSTAWCGLAQAYAMALLGIEPPFGPLDVDKFLYVDAWEVWGIPIAKADAQPGDIIVFRGGGMHHVSMLDHVDGDRFVCRGGNQSDAVTVASYPQSACTAVRRPPPATDIPSVPPEVAIIISKANNFEACLAAVLIEEGGNDDNPSDPGGRTSRGILQKEWNVYIRSHPGLPSDVFDAPQADVETIYHQQYWDVVWGDKLLPGVDLVVFDMAVLQGVGRVGDLQAIVGTPVDNEIGPLTIAAVNSYVAANGAADLINQLMDKRLAHLQGLSTWGTFGRGWTNRIAHIRQKALAMAAAPPQPQEPPVTVPPDVTPPTPPSPTPLPVPPVPPAQSAPPDLAAIFAAFQQMAQQLPAILSQLAVLHHSVAQLRAQLPAGLHLPSFPSVGLPAPPVAVDPSTGAVVTTTPTVAVDASNKTGVGAGILGVIVSLALAAIGVTGTPVGEAATTTGAVLPLISAGVAGLGAFGKLAPLLRAVLAML